MGCECAASHAAFFLYFLKETRFIVVLLLQTDGDCVYACASTVQACLPPRVREQQISEPFDWK